MTITVIGCTMNYSLHHEFSDHQSRQTWQTKQTNMAGKHSVTTLTKNLLQRENPFNLEQPKGIITNGAILEKDEEDCLMNCISLGKAADEFYESCLTEKSIQLLETIPKTRKSTKKMNERKEYDLAKKTVKFLRHINYAGWQNFDLKIFMAMKSHLLAFILQKEV